MPTFATPEPITATVTVAGAEVRVAASDRTDTAVLVEPINKASRSDVKVASKTKVDFAGGQLTVKTTVSGDKNGSVAIAIDLPADSSLVAYLAHSSVHVDGPLGECDLHMASGQAQFDRINTLQANISAGEVAIGHVSGRAHIESSTGQIRIGHASADLELSNGSGGFDIDRADSSVTATTADGAIRIGLADTRPGGADERLRKHRDRHQRGHRCSGGREQRAGIGSQLRPVAGRPWHVRQQACGPRPHAARRHHHSARSKLTSRRWRRYGVIASVGALARFRSRACRRPAVTSPSARPPAPPRRTARR